MYGEQVKKNLGQGELSGTTDESLVLPAAGSPSDWSWWYIVHARGLGEPWNLLLLILQQKV